MASTYYGVNAGQHYTDAKVGAATGGTDVELRVDLSKVDSREQVLEALEQLRIQLMQQPFPFN